MEVLEREERETRCIYRLIMCRRGEGGGNVPPPAILIKLIDVANYCGKIFNCILALKRIKSEFPSLCFGTVRSRHSSVLYRVDILPRVYADSPCHRKGSSQLSSPIWGLRE